MTTYIKSLGIDVWQSIVSGWNIPTKVENGKVIIKTKPEWNNEEKKAALRNFIAFHAIQCGMDNRKFRLIASLNSTKEAWDTLQEIFEKPRHIDLNKGGDRALKKYKSQIACKNDQEDRERVNKHKACNFITKIDEVEQQRMLKGVFREPPKLRSKN